MSQGVCYLDYSMRYEFQSRYSPKPCLKGGAHDENDGFGKISPRYFDRLLHRSAFVCPLRAVDKMMITLEILLLGVCWCVI